MDGQIYDVELYFQHQEPPWRSLEWLQWPEEWVPEYILGPDQNPVGARFVTASAPMPVCTPLNFQIAVEVDGKVGDSILIYLTDKDHQVIGQIVAQRTPSNRQAVYGLSIAQSVDCITSNGA